MSVYRFRVLWEENEEVERTILIQSNQTFLDFFNILTSSFELEDKTVSASFFTSDDYWDKHQEITLRESDIQADEKLMEKTKIESQIEQAHQRFIFVYDTELQLTFLIELIRIEKDKEEKYPKVISSKGKIPKRKKTKKSLNLSNDACKTVYSNTLSDEEIDKMIYNKISEIDITEEDILTGKLDHFFNEFSENKKLDEDDIEEDNFEDEFFDEIENKIDNDDFHQDGYYDEYEN